jgi:hypothetical protein
MRPGVALSPNHHHDPALVKTQADQALLSVSFAVVFIGDHWKIEDIRDVLPNQSRVCAG